MDWLLLSEIWFSACRRFGHEISHHALAVAMHRMDEGRQTWDEYLKRAEVECQRQWDLEEAKVQTQKAHHEQRGVVFVPTQAGWEIRVRNTYIWNYQSVKAWLADYDIETAWFYEGTHHVQ